MPNAVNIAKIILFFLALRNFRLSKIVIIKYILVTPDKILTSPVFVKVF